MCLYYFQVVIISSIYEISLNWSHKNDTSDPTAKCSGFFSFLEQKYSLFHVTIQSSIPTFFPLFFCILLKIKTYLDVYYILLLLICDKKRKWIQASCTQNLKISILDTYFLNRTAPATPVKVK